MNPTIITVSNQKGGTGKTALTFEIGKIISRSHRVLFIDLDGQGDLTRMFTKESPQVSTLEVLQGYESAKKAILNINDNIALIPSTEDLLNADIELLSKGNKVADCLKTALKSLKGFDYIMIDTPPKLGTLTTNALKASDIIYIPTLAENNSIDGVMNFIKTFMAVNRTRKVPARIGGIIVTRYNGRSLINRQMLESIEGIAEQIHTRVYTVKETVKLREAHFFGESILKYAPNTDTAKQLLSIVDDMEKA